MKIENLLKIREIKIFFFDLDGVLIHPDAANEKCAEAVEKYALSFLQLGALFGIVTAREEDELILRLKSIENCVVLAGSINKTENADRFLKSRSINYKNAFYMGDDLLDIPLLQKCGFSAAPKKARREVKRVVTFISSAEKCEDVLKEIYNNFKKSKEPASRATKH